MDATSRPRLAPAARLRFDTTRESWVVLAPERVTVLDEVAADVLQRCDGQATLAEVVDGLSAAYEAPRDAILADVDELLANLVELGVVVS
jgi:pyrroloquinoline quinone biosynthesis protein D